MYFKLCGPCVFFIWWGSSRFIHTYIHTYRHTDIQTYTYGIWLGIQSVILWGSWTTQQWSDASLTMSLATHRKSWRVGAEKNNLCIKMKKTKDMILDFRMDRHLPSSPAMASCITKAPPCTHSLPPAIRQEASLRAGPQEWGTASTLRLVRL